MSTDSNTNTGQNNTNTTNSGNTQQTGTIDTISGIIKQATKTVLDNIESNGKPYPEPEEIGSMILAQTNSLRRANNIFVEKGEKIRVQYNLIPNTIADILIRFHHAVYIVENINDPKYGSVAIYAEDGPNKGIYVTNEAIIAQVIMEYRYNISAKEIAEVLKLLAVRAPAVARTKGRHLIAVNNGIFDYDKKVLMPFDSKYIFTSKSHVDFNPNATNVVIHNPNDGTDWDIESWMNEIASNDPEMVELFWQICGAVIRPNVSWNRAVLFYSESGNNGKGTLCQLFRSIVGEDSCASLSLTDMGKDFMLEPLTHASAIINDENDVGIYIDKAANFKALVTADTISINRKHQMPISYKWHGVVLECLNEMPRVKDKSDSFMRRQLFVPFKKCFTGAERKYIKNDYLKRKDVLEYVLKKVLVDTDYYEFTTPEVCKEALETYKEYVDPVRQFANDIFPNASWDLLPFEFLYDMYKAWYNRTNPTGSMQSRPSFVKDIKALVRSGDISGWTLVGDGNGKIRPGTKMSKPEPLIAEYDLKDWMNPNYKNADKANTAIKCTPTIYQIRDNYRGVLRDTVSDTVTIDD